MKVLVINLTRFGDLLQTQPLLHDLHAAGHTTGLFCLDNFSSAASLLTDLDYTAELPGGDMLCALHQDWRTALAGVRGMLTQIQQEFPAQSIINTTATPGARLLTHMLTPQSGHCHGFSTDICGMPVDLGLWAGILLGSVRHRGAAAFNMADMFRLMGGMGEGQGCNGLRAPHTAAQAKAEALLFSSTPAQGFVGIQLGASAPKRQWPVEYFAAIGDKLWQELGIIPVLLGVAGERPLAKRYAALTAAPFIDATGRTDIPTLAGILQRMRLLLTNDTGTMHLAAGLGIPSLALFLATAQPWDTGPYLENCCCLEPDLPCHPCEFSTTCAMQSRCLTSIQPETVFALLHAYLTAGRWEAAALESLRGVRAWVTCRDTRGLQDLRAITAHEHTSRTRWMRQQRLRICHIIDRLEGRTTSSPHIFPEQGHEDMPHIHAFIQALEAVILHGRRLMRRADATARRQLIIACEKAAAALQNTPECEQLGKLWEAFCYEHVHDLPKLTHGAVELRDEASIWGQAASNCSGTYFAST